MNEYYDESAGGTGPGEPGIARGVLQEYLSRLGSGRQMYPAAQMRGEQGGALPGPAAGVMQQGFPGVGADDAQPDRDPAQGGNAGAAATIPGGVAAYDASAGAGGLRLLRDVKPASAVLASPFSAMQKATGDPVKVAARNDTGRGTGGFRLLRDVSPSGAGTSAFGAPQQQTPATAGKAAGPGVPSMKPSEGQPVKGATGGTPMPPRKPAAPQKPAAGGVKTGKAPKAAKAGVISVEEPPSPPGTPKRGEPGSAQYDLVHAQDIARAKKKNQPERDETTGKLKTKCNLAVSDTAKAMNAPMGPLQTPVKDKNGKTTGYREAQANEMADNLAKSDEYEPVTAEQAQKLANEGKLVIGVQREKGHGHVTTVRPDNLETEKRPAVGRGPVMNHVGTHVKVTRASGAFYSPDTVIYYTPRVRK